MEQIEEVALRALLYREHYRARHTCAEDLLTDFECCRGEVTLATLVGADTLAPQDWAIVNAMHDGGLSELAPHLDAPRAEALLHVWPEDAPPPEGQWTLPFGADRWRAVEEEMERLRATGLTASRDDVELVAVAAYGAATSRTHAEYMDEYADTIFEP